MGGSCCSAAVNPLDEDSMEQLQSDGPSTMYQLGSTKNGASCYEGRQYEKDLANGGAHTGSTASTTWSLTQTSQSEFFYRLQKGVEVMVIPLSRTGILCRLHVDIGRNQLVLTKDTNSRVVDLEDIQRVMFKKADLQRVENHTALAEDDHCCAILLKSFSCIGLRFSTTSDMHSFVETIHDLLSSAEAINAG